MSEEILPTPSVKPGYKTSEFWLTVAASVIGLLLASGLIHAGTPIDRVVGLAASVLGTLGYTVSRGIAKR